MTWFIAAHQEVGGFVPQDTFPVVREDSGELVDEEAKQAGRRGTQGQHNNGYAARQIRHKEALCR